MGKEELHEVGDGGGVVWMGWDDGEGIVEVSWEGVDEGCGKVVRGEVRFEISRKDVGNRREFVVADTVDVNWEMARNWWGCSKGGLETVTTIDDGAI